VPLDRRGLASLTIDTCWWHQEIPRNNGRGSHPQGEVIGEDAGVAACESDSARSGEDVGVEVDQPRCDVEPRYLHQGRYPWSMLRRLVRIRLELAIRDVVGVLLDVGVPLLWQII
jgi:hypothetical protein